MPTTIKAYTVCCDDDTYTIVLNARHSMEQLMLAYHHEMKHIENGDYDKPDKDVQVVEIFAHREERIFNMDISKEQFKNIKEGGFSSFTFLTTAKYINGTSSAEKTYCSIGLYNAGLLLDVTGNTKSLYKSEEITNVFLANPYIVIEFIDDNFWVLSASDKNSKNI